MTRPTIARVGLISDTHGELPEQVHDVFADVQAIVHAGDVGAEEVLYELQTIAPVTAVSGNMDRPFPSWPLPATAGLRVGCLRLLVVHKRARASLSGTDADILVYGHTHVPEVTQAGGVTEVNPGSASQSRTTRGRGTVALLTVRDGAPAVQVIELSS